MAAKKENRILVCPKCGGTSIAPHSKKKREIKRGDVFEAYYGLRVCETCNYTGHFFPDVPVSKLRRIRNEIKKLQKEK